MGDTHNGRAVNGRQMFTDRSSTRIYAPPGGHSSFSLGGGSWTDATSKKPSSHSNKSSKYSNSSFIDNDALDCLVNSIPGLNRRSSHGSAGNHRDRDSASGNSYAAQLKDQIDMKRRIEENKMDSRNSSNYGEKENYQSTQSQHHRGGQSQGSGNSYAEQLKEQIAAKRRIDEDMESRYNGGQRSGRKGGYQNESSYDNAPVRSAPIANGRRGNNPVGGASSFNLGW